MRASRAKVAGLQETPIALAAPDEAICAAWASAPALGGSNTTASMPLSSWARTGRRNRSRASAVIRFSPGVAPTAAESAATASAETSAASTWERSARRRAKAPTPQNRSAVRSAPAAASTTKSAMAASASDVACRKPPGGRVTRARPIRTSGRLDW